MCIVAESLAEQRQTYLRILWYKISTNVPRIWMWPSVSCIVCIQSLPNWSKFTSYRQEESIMNKKESLMSRAKYLSWEELLITIVKNAIRRLHLGILKIEISSEELWSQLMTYKLVCQELFGFWSWLETSI